jgi:hypothetical protein
MAAGSYPRTADEVNNLIGGTLKTFISVKEALVRHQDWLAQGSTDLKVAPYSMTASDETNLKTAVAGLNTALAAIDLTFVKRCVGP